MKSTGKCKIGHQCTASMAATETIGGKVSVLYCTTHYGHDLDVGHLFLTNSQKDAIVAELFQGATASQILHNIKSSTYEFIHSTTMKNINRIRDSYGIKNTEVAQKNSRLSFSNQKIKEEIIVPFEKQEDVSPVGQEDWDSKIEEKREKCTEIQKAVLIFLKNTTDPEILDRVSSLGKKQLSLLTEAAS